MVDVVVVATGAVVVVVGGSLGTVIVVVVWTFASAAVSGDVVVNVSVSAWIDVLDSAGSSSPSCPPPEAPHPASPKTVSKVAAVKAQLLV